jgi:hypothetical protein
LREAIGILLSDFKHDNLYLYYRISQAIIW